ncbi:L-serine ammonia-lyase [Kineococcus rhizosphaerae]|uniref:L-serine dehydratase n=1 Tax=Kineococcus rhizosphaerae TaxID=559628 RepID=A0A2T0R605_9ACTN|nr:L-serine ammonia-lyase [Kineococcus rhizosphaerae]PRY16593.1 L-serine dehydratase [Kineococcus rhizosphaerae]
MALSVFDMFSIGIGPSSSHTVGPMRAALAFAEGLERDGLLPRVRSVTVDLHGSLGATGRGHGSDRAVVLGLLGERPELVDPDAVEGYLDEIRASRELRVLRRHAVGFDPDADVRLVTASLPAHPNGMVFTARDGDGNVLAQRTSYSVGGGFVKDDPLDAAAPVVGSGAGLPWGFRTAAELLEHCRETGLGVADLVRRNEESLRPAEEVDAGLLRIFAAMRACVDHGLVTDGTLPGGLGVRRRAPRLHAQLLAEEGSSESDVLHAMDWVSLFALAVNEENAAGGRVVTAPTNGAAGIVPAVLHFHRRFVPGADDAATVRFLLAAGGIGIVLKETGSISGAEVGCQGEVGSASAMAAAGLAEVLGGTPEQVENAAEIAVEHHLGLTCDPVGGLVQIPCIERNAVGATTAIHAARTALRGDGSHVVSLDTAIATMRQTGAHMRSEYKETSLGGLALTVVGRPAVGVNVPEC